MALRRKGTAPQTEFAVMAERLAVLEDQVKQLRQAAASHIQSDRMDEAIDPFPWETMINWPGGHRPAFPFSSVLYFHPGRTDPITGEVIPAGWKQIAPPATHAIKVFSDNRLNKVRDGAFRFDIEEDLANTKIVSVAAFNGTVGSGTTTVQIENVTRGITILTTPITIDAGESNSFTAAVQPQISTGGVAGDPNNKVHLGDSMWINTLAVGAGSMGLGVYMTFA